MHIYKPSFARMLRRGTHPVDGSSLTCHRWARLRRRALPTDKILAYKCLINKSRVNKTGGFVVCGGRMPCEIIIPVF
ncbi:MAG: hypothetical protein ACE5GG_05940, partial [Candidatus Omnitrophota bacterium]